MSANYFERKELLRLRKENAELHAKLTKLVGERITGPSSRFLYTERFDILSGEAIIRFDGKVHKVKSGDVLHISVPIDIN